MSKGDPAFTYIHILPIKKNNPQTTWWNSSYCCLTSHGPGLSPHSWAPEWVPRVWPPGPVQSSHNNKHSPTLDGNYIESDVQFAKTFSSHAFLSLLSFLTCVRFLTSGPWVQRSHLSLPSTRGWVLPWRYGRREVWKTQILSTCFPSRIYAWESV